MRTKVCCRCGVEKPIEEFYVNRAGKPIPACRACERERGRAYYHAKHPGARAYGPNFRPRQCVSCGEVKPSSEFNVTHDKGGSYQYHKRCAACEGDPLRRPARAARTAARRKG